MNHYGYSVQCAVHREDTGFPRGSASRKGGHLPIIRPNFSENCNIMMKILLWGHLKFYDLDPPLAHPGMGLSPTNS